MTNIKTVTDEQIEQLESEASRVLDHVQVGLCRIALTGRFGDLNLTDSERARLRNTSRRVARAECARVIMAARAEQLA